MQSLVWRRVGRRRAHGEDGFTLVELLVVIAILGILAGVVVFAVGGMGDKGQSAALQTDARILQTAEETYCANHGNYGTAQELVDDRLLSELPAYHGISLSDGGPCTANSTVQKASKYVLACINNLPGCTVVADRQGDWSGPADSTVVNGDGQRAVLMSNGDVLRVVLTDFAAGTWASEIWSAGQWRKTANAPASVAQPAVGPLTALPGRKALFQVAVGLEGAPVAWRLYDATTDTWSVAAQPAATHDHSLMFAPMTGEGKVLAAGGYSEFPKGDIADQSVADLYDPVTGLWTPTASMNAGTHQVAAMLTLPDGSVLLVDTALSGHNFNHTPNTPNVERYLSGVTGSWISGGNLPAAFQEDPNGGNFPTLVGVANGALLTSANKTALFYLEDSALKRIDKDECRCGPGRIAVALDNTRVLVVDPTKDKDKTWLYDAAHDTGTGVSPTGWARTGGSYSDQKGAAAVRLADGRIMLVGGGLPGDPAKSQIYTPPAP